MAVSVNGTWFFPDYDANGNILAYRDENRALAAEYAYDAFGNTIAESGLLASVFPHRFSTKYYDAETGLYYYGYRYYSPSLGRWISRDPIGELGGMNFADPLRLISRIKSSVPSMTESYDTIGVLIHGRMNLTPGTPGNPEPPRPFDDLEFVHMRGSSRMDRMLFFRLLSNELTNARILCDLQVVSCYQDWDLLGLDESIPFEERDNATKEHLEITVPNIPNHETIHSASDPLDGCPLDFVPFKFFRKYGPGED